MDLEILSELFSHRFGKNSRFTRRSKLFDLFISTWSAMVSASNIVHSIFCLKLRKFVLFHRNCDLDTNLMQFFFTFFFFIHVNAAKVRLQILVRIFQNGQNCSQAYDPNVQHSVFIITCH